MLRLFKPGGGANPRIARIQWRIAAGAFQPDQFQLVFLSDTIGGGAKGPELLNAENYSIIMGSEGTYERFPIVHDFEPYPVDATESQTIWLSRFPRLPGQDWQVAIIDHTKWDARIWGRWELAFQNRQSIYTETGALRPADTYGQVSRAIRLWPEIDLTRPESVRWNRLRQVTGTLPEGERWTEQHKLEGVSGVHVEIIQPGSNYWNELPKLEFLVMGKKFTWPGSPESERSPGSDLDGQCCCCSLRHSHRVRRGLPHD